MHVSDFGFDFISAALQGIPQSVLHHDLLSGYERKEWRGGGLGGTGEGVSMNG